MAHCVAEVEALGVKLARDGTREDRERFAEGLEYLTAIHRRAWSAWDRDRKKSEVYIHKKDDSFQLQDQGEGTVSLTRLKEFLAEQESVRRKFDDERPNLEEGGAEQGDADGRGGRSRTGGRTREPPSPERAEALIKEEKPAEAERLLDRLLRAIPGDPELLAMRAVARLNQENSLGALEDANAALARDPRHEGASQVKTFVESSGRGAGANVKLRRPDFGGLSAGEAGPSGGARVQSPAGESQAAEWATFGTSPAPTATERAKTVHGDPGPTSALLLLESARRKFKLGDVSGALLEVTRALAADKSNPRAWALRAAISNRLGNHDAAVKDATEALRLDPKNVGALVERGYARYNLGQYPAALEDLGAAITLEPTNALAHLYRAMVLEKLQRFTEAIVDYEAAVRLDPALKPLLDEARARMGFGGPGSGGRGGAPLPPWAVVGALGALLLWWLNRPAARTSASVAAPEPEPSPREEFPAPLAAGFSPGSVLGGNFRVEGELGSGGMGIVYLALDITLKRAVAIKRLKPEMYQSPEMRDRFLKEAQFAARLRHPHLAEIFSVVSDPDGELYLVFELVPGESLDALLKKRGKLELAEARRILGGVASALDYAHGERVIHRDLKPGNIMVDSQGRAKVMDLGLARETRSPTDMTQTAAWGTPLYMAPEQHLGRISRASDLYALGVMAYEMLTGSRPFQGGAILDNKLNGVFPKPSSLNPGLSPHIDAALARALDPDPDKRFASAAELVGALA